MVRRLRHAVLVPAALVAAIACQRPAERSPARGAGEPARAPAATRTSVEDHAPGAVASGGPVLEEAASGGLLQENAAPAQDVFEGASEVGAPSAPVEDARSPTGITAAAVSESEVDLRWQAPKGARDVARYEVLRGSAVVATTTSATARDTGLSPATRLCYAVRSVDGRGRRSPPSAPACITTPDLTPPGAPQGLAAEATSDREVTLRWTAASDLVGVAAYEVLADQAVLLTTGATAAKLAGLAPGRRYCFAVVARDAAGNRSAASQQACATTRDVTPPSVPGALTASATSETDVELRWTEASDDAGVRGYRLLRGGVVIQTVEVTAAGDAGLRAGKEYCYSVVAFDDAGNESRPAGPACATTLDLTPPSPPGHPVATATSEEHIEVRWAASHDNVGVASYEVKRAGEVRARANGLAAGESGLRPFTEHCYSVLALDAAGNRSAPSSATCARTLDVTPPSVPGALVVRAWEQGELEARWGSSTDNHRVAGYELLRDGSVVASSAGPSAAESGLTPGQEYCFAVRAYDAAGNRSAETARVCAKTLEADQPPPPRNVAIQRKPGAIQIGWDPPARADVVYRVYEDRRPVGATRFSRYAVQRAADGKRHCYSVGTVDDAGRESPRSEEACLAVLGETSSAR